jgi:hypothetical protein
MFMGKKKAPALKKDDTPASSLGETNQVQAPVQKMGTPSPIEEPKYEQMKKAYQASATLIKKELAATSKEDLAMLEQISENDILVVPGVYDRIQEVLSLVGIKFKMVDPSSFERLELHPSQVVFVNCPGTGFSRAGLDRLKYFVRDGGLLVTTDWALQNVIESAFPGFIQYNQRSTTDDVVKIEVLDSSHPYIQGLMSSKDSEPLWWLESSSYPIRVVDKDKVKVLVTSKEMQDRYGEPTIVCTFKMGQGEVLHLTSHYYLQRTETRGKGKEAKAGEFFKSKMAAAGAPAPAMDAQFEDVGFKEVESAYTSQKFVANVVLEQKKKWQEKQKQEEKKDSAKDITK